MSLDAPQPGGVEVLRGQAADGRPTLLRRALGEPDDPGPAALRREYALLTALAGCAVPEVIALTSGHRSTTLVLADGRERTLRRVLAERGGRLTVPDALDLAIAAVAALATIHARDVVHCDVRPDNLRVPDTLDRVVLDGLGDALGPGDAPRPEGPSLAALPYVSPEQTGRLHRPVDYRSDFYGLGITLFECLAGRLPFPRGDPAEMFHCHIARRPPGLADVAPDVPPALARLVDRLLAKVADERYQSHDGLTFDLVALRDLSRRGPLPDDLPLAARDAPRSVLAADRLVGRDAAEARLLAALERVAAGALELVLVAGASGIGKSTLIEAARRPALARGGAFTRGRCDRARRAPYDAPVQALRHALRGLLRLPERPLADRRARLHAHLGDNAGVLTEVLPELVPLLGAPPRPPELPPKESENRFRATLGAVVTALAAPGRPLVLVLDDLQWADLPTLDLLVDLARGPEAPALLIGAYRDDEVDDDHPLRRHLLARLDELPVRVTRERLGPLDEAECAALLRAALPRSAAPIEPLARFIHAKAEGNPFVIRSFLGALVEQGLVRHDPERGGWWWQLDALRTARISDDVASLMAGRLGALPERTRRTLRLAACLGDRFSAEMLAEVLELRVEAIGEDLWQAVSAGFILPLTASESLEPGTPYRFAHDRVRDAARALLAPDELELANLRIGRVLAARLADPDRDEAVFSVVRHLNAAAARLDPDERLRLADLNLRAGRRARQATAYEVALGLLRAGIDLLPARAWDDAYPLAFALHRECMTAEHLAARHDDAERRCEPLLARARTARERAELHLLRVVLATSRGENHRALDIGRAGLALLGVDLPPRGRPLAVAARFAALQLRLLGRGAEDLARLPATHDPDRRLALDLLMALAPPAYMVDTDLMAWIGLRMVDESLRHGATAASAYAFLILGLLDAGVLERYQHAQVCADTAEALLRRFPDPILAVRVEFTLGSYLRCWVRPFAECAAALERAHELGVRHGDLLYASFSTGNLISVQLAESVDLARIERYAERVRGFVARVQGDDGERLILAMLRLARVLRGATPRLGRFDGPDWDEAAFAAALSEQRTPLTLVHFTMYRALVALHFGRRDEAARHALAAVPLEGASLSNGVLGVYWFYQAVAAAERLPDATPAERPALTKMLRRARARLGRCAAAAPRNFAARHELVRALDARLSGRDPQALALLQRAAALAREQAAHAVEGLACELAAALCHDLGDPALGRFHAETARAAYLRWGAEGVARGLVDRHPDWFAHEPPPSRPPSAARSVASEVDLDAVLRASRALSGEIVLTRLLARLVEILMTSAGARRCFVLLSDPAGLALHAVGDVDRPEVDLLPGAPLSAAPRLAASVVHYVARTRHEVVLDDGPAGTPFDGDAGLERARSLLCAPLLHQGELLGVVYLDNELARGVFTASRVEVLRQLAAHVAIAVRNANLYRELDAARERAVSADLAKSRFLLNMSHELRTPLNAVMGYAELGEEDLAAGDLDGCRDGLRKIQDAGHRLLRTLTRILELSRLESGELRVRPARVELGPLFAELALQVESLALSNRDALTTRVAPDCPALETDRSMLTTILLCLLENACRFTRDGRIHLHAAPAPDAPEHVRIAVEDTGIGIPREMLARIFDRFVQVDDSATRTVEGAGIGLTIAQGLAARLGGAITVTSELGVGSCFALLLPIGA